jgi:thioredoxin reductase (NADPH)
MASYQLNADFDLIIIGGGPAGLTAAQYGARANLRTVVLEQMAAGGQARLIDVLENYPGIAPGKTGYDFCQDLYRQAEQFGAAFLTEQVMSLEKSGRIFAVTVGKDKTLTAQAVILATGAKHRALDIPGEQAFYGRGVSYCATCDGPFFKDKKIFVVGGGDAACDEAQYLSRLTDRVVLIHRRDKFRAQKALAERVLRNPNIEVRFNTIMKEIHGTPDLPPLRQKTASVTLEKTAGGGKGSGETWDEAADAVFIFAGTIPQTSLVPAVEKDEAGYVITDQAMASSLPGLFAAGDVRAAPFRQVVVAAGEGAIAAHSAASYIDELTGGAQGSS